MTLLPYSQNASSLFLRMTPWRMTSSHQAMTPLSFSMTFPDAWSVSYCSNAPPVPDIRTLFLTATCYLLAPTNFLRLFDCSGFGSGGPIASRYASVCRTSSSLLTDNTMFGSP